MRRPASFLFIIVIALALIVAPGCDSLAVIPANASASAPRTASPAPTATPEPQTATPEPAATAEPTATPEPTVEPTAAPTATSAPVSEDVSLIFAGDLMFHSPFVSSARTKTGYDFSDTLQSVEPALQGADFAIANLETPVWDPRKSALSFDRFAAPPEAVTYLAGEGFDVLTTANNHAMDQGAEALANTIQVIRAAGLKTTGTWTNEQERDDICMLQKNGVKIAIVAYGRHPKMYSGFDHGMGSNVINIDDMKESVKRAKDAGADAVILCLHFGNEYTFTPTGFFQQESVKAMRAAGALAIIGAHPHVLQPMALDPDGKFFVAYSLGNLLTDTSTQQRQFAALLKMTVRKDPSTGAVTVSSLTYIPTWTRRLKESDGKVHTRVFDIRDAITACQEGTDPAIPHKYLNELTNGYEWIKNMLGEQYLDPSVKQ